MHWQSFSEFLAMGGYGGFVWTAYALTALVLTGMAIASVKRLQAGRADLANAELLREKNSEA